ncbi:hypothetical protein V501_01011 [Pseudogymnoascus sp. VKM F-4519 (FW-2642)]|nr:hypothetical protein V501_01011 [Pseudogymnoascus sp. VKM F-4519 (FW-2642)]
MAKRNRVHQTAAALFTQFPTNGRIPFKQVLQATWVATFALFIGICFVLAIVFFADGKPTSSNKWYEYTPTFIALGAVVIRGSVAALLGITLYQNLWQNVAAPAKANKELRVETGGEGGISLKRVESLHLASRLAARVEVQAVMFNNTHYLRHLCMVQSAIGSCATHITAGIGSMGNLACLRDQFINVDSDLDKKLSFYGPAGGVPSLLISFLKVFVGKAVLDIHNRLNYGQSLFVMGTMVADTEKTLVMPSDLLSHMQRVLWVTPLLAKFGTPEQEALNVTMTVLDERNIIVYKTDKPRIIVTLAVLLIIGLGCLVYLSLCSSGACGRLARDSLVHSLTVAGPNGPAIKGACLASLDEILDKAGDEELKFGVLLEASDSVSGHLGFSGQPLAPGSHQSTPVATVGKPVPGRWYGGQGGLRKKKPQAEVR